MAALNLIQFMYRSTSEIRGNDASFRVFIRMNNFKGYFRILYFGNLFKSETSYIIMHKGNGIG